MVTSLRFIGHGRLGFAGSHSSPRWEMVVAKVWNRVACWVDGHDFSLIRYPEEGPVYHCPWCCAVVADYGPVPIQFETLRNVTVTVVKEWLDHALIEADHPQARPRPDGIVVVTAHNGRALYRRAPTAEFPTAARLVGSVFWAPKEWMVA